MGSLLILFQYPLPSLGAHFVPGLEFFAFHSSIRLMVDGEIWDLRIGFMFMFASIWELFQAHCLSIASMSPPSICAVPNSAISLNASTCSAAVCSHTPALLLPQPNSGSEEDPHHVIDERKQKRMLSNRESARRSRMRKQQHLDELRAQAAQLRAENNHILIKFNIASHHYLQLQEENSVLRSHAMHLSLKLRSLNIAMQWVGGSSGLDLDAGFLDSNFWNAMDVKPWNLPSIPQALPATEIFQ